MKTVFLEFSLSVRVTVHFVHIRVFITLTTKVKTKDHPWSGESPLRFSFYLSLLALHDISGFTGIAYYQGCVIMTVACNADLGSNSALHCTQH